MELVVDTNELFSFFESDPKVRRILLHPDLKLFSPDFVLEEINNLSDKIKRSAGINETKYIFLFGILSALIKIISKEKYEREIEKAKFMISDINDVTFLALALGLGVPIWSDDKDFLEQNEIGVFSTNDLYKHLFN